MKLRKKKMAALCCAFVVGLTSVHGVKAFSTFEYKSRKQNIVENIKLGSNMLDITNLKEHYNSHGIADLYYKDGVVTVTANRDDGYCFVEQFVDLKQDKKYLLEVDMERYDGVQDVYLVKRKTAESGWIVGGYISRTKQTIISPPEDGMYELRFDVNQKGKTGKFWDVRLREIVN